MEDERWSWKRKEGKDSKSQEKSGRLKLSENRQSPKIKSKGDKRGSKEQLTYPTSDAKNENGPENLLLHLSCFIPPSLSLSLSLTHSLTHSLDLPIYMMYLYL